LNGSEQEAVINQSPAERRWYKRERVELIGRHFEATENREADCAVSDMSPGGARILSEVVPPLGAHIIVYIEGFGRFEGNVVRPEQNGFGIQFHCSPHKRLRIAEKLKVYLEGGSLHTTALRRHERTPTIRMVSFTRSNGEVANCKVLDFSLSGVSLATQIQPPVGEFVLIDQMPGRIARHHDRGICIEFGSRGKLVGTPARAKVFAAH
jgi:hypothetical protein